MTETWTHTMNEYCSVFMCCNCPMRRGNLCFYEELKGDE